MAEVNDPEGTLRASEPKPGDTSKALRELWEAAENAVEAIVRRNKGHDQEKVAEFAALRVSEIAKTAAHLKSKSIVEIMQAERNEKTPALRKESDTTMTNNEKSDKTLIPILVRTSINDSTSTKEARETVEDIRPSVTFPWKKVKTLGRGAFGVVHLGEDEKGLRFAAKEVEKDGVVDQSLQAEIDFLVRLSHTNIVRYFGHHSEGYKMYMFMELMEGSIRDKLDNDGTPLPTRMARKYTKEILNGLIFLHQNNIIHRDIKCGNVLLDGNDTAKLADMGVSKVHESITITLQENRAGSIHWMSPEMMEAKGGGKRSDVWSVGCTVYEMVKEYPPFWEVKGYAALFHLFQKILQKEHRTLVLSHEDMDHKLREFLLAIFVDKNDRPYAEDLAKHSWLQ